MTITGRFFTYTPHTLASTIPDTLENLNAGFTGLQDEQRAGLRALLNGRLLVFGFKPVSQALPLITVSRGTVVTPEGVLVEYPPGELEYIPHEDATNYLYLAANYTIDIATELPEDALALLATCAPNEDFSELVFDLEVLVETCTYTADGLLQSVEKTNGTRVLASQFFLYNAQRQVELVFEVGEDGAYTIKEWAYNEDGLPVRSGVSFAQGLSLVLGDSLFTGLGETLVQGFD